MSKVRPPYPAEFRQQMVELVRAGRTPAEFSREFNVTAQSITNWVGQARHRQRQAVARQGRLEHG